MPNMKQGTLGFASVKRTNLAHSKPQKRTLATEKGETKRLETQVEAQNDHQPGDIVDISSGEEGRATSETTVPAKRTRPSTKARSFPGIKKATTSQLSQCEKRPSPVEIEREHLDTEDKAGRYRKYYNEVRLKMGYLKPLHSESQNKIHQMLRFFDMSYEFGPCIGMTRLERWERAAALGLNPPVEVRDILLTEEGAEYAQCVLHGEV